MFDVNEVVGYKRFNTNDDIDFAIVDSVEENVISLKVLKSEAYKSRSEVVAVNITEKVHEKVFKLAPSLVEAKKAELEKEITNDATQSKKLFKNLKFMFTKEEKAELKATLAAVIDAKIAELNDDKTSIVGEE